MPRKYATRTEQQKEKIQEQLEGILEKFGVMTLREIVLCFNNYLNSRCHSVMIGAVLKELVSSNTIQCHEKIGPKGGKGYCYKNLKRYNQKDWE